MSIEFAIKYAAAGWHVFPVHSIVNGQCTCGKGKNCKAPGKHPRIKDWHSVSTTDPKIIRTAWSVFPSANIGIVTGQKSNLMVIDIDPRNGGVEGLAKIEEKFGRLPDDNVVQTGGDGYHYYYSYPEEGTIRNGTSVLAEGVDIKGDKGYVVAPPSKHIEYTWRNTSC